MKKTAFYSFLEGIARILPPLLISSVLSVLYLLFGKSTALVFGSLIWLSWLVYLIFTIRKESPGYAMVQAILLFISCGFYAITLATKYELFSLPIDIQALFTLFSTPYTVMVMGIRSFLPEEGTAAIFACSIYLILVIVASGYAAHQFGQNKNKK